MKSLLCLTLALLQWQPMPRTMHAHWCDQPTRNLRWLNRLIQDAQSWPATHYGWEVQQARFRGHEVFVLHLCRRCGQQRGFLVYNHQGRLISQGDGADSVVLSQLTNVRLLANDPGRFRVQR